MLCRHWNQASEVDVTLESGFWGGCHENMLRMPCSPSPVAYAAFASVLHAVFAASSAATEKQVSIMLATYASVTGGHPSRSNAGLHAFAGMGPARGLCGACMHVVPGAWLVWGLHACSTARGAQVAD